MIVSISTSPLACSLTKHVADVVEWPSSSSHDDPSAEESSLSSLPRLHLLSIACFDFDIVELIDLSSADISLNSKLRLHTHSASDFVDCNAKFDFDFVDLVDFKDRVAEAVNLELSEFLDAVVTFDFEI